MCTGAKLAYMQHWYVVVVVILHQVYVKMQIHFTVASTKTED